MSARRLPLALLVAALLAAASAVPAQSTPVCAGAGMPDGCPQSVPWGPAPVGTSRVFQEPAQSTNWTQFGPDAAGRSEFADGTRALQKRYPNYVRLTTLAQVLHDPDAVSIGYDGKPPWDPADENDGLPLYLVEVTDFRVPDDEKALVFVTAVHSAEPCGREAIVRAPEDLALQAAGGASIDNGTGVTAGTKSIKVADLLTKEKIYFVYNSPDGWRSGDQDVGNILRQQSHQDRPSAQSQYGGVRWTYSEENGRGVNTNRQAPSVGWMFRQPKPYAEPGQNPILTEPEGIATYRFVKLLQAQHGPFDGVMDIHGPVPAPADIMLPDGQFDPHHEQLLYDMAIRVKDRMDASVGQHLQSPELERQVEAATGTSSRWTLVGQVWDTINYTVTGAYGFWLPQLGGIGTNYENNCVPAANSDWSGAYQVFVDSARAALDTTLVQALWQKDVKTTIDPKGRVGYVFNPDVVTDADGNPSPPPADFPNNPAFPHGFTQEHYSATSMNFLRDESKYAVTPFTPLATHDVAAGSKLAGLDTVVLVNHAFPRDVRDAKKAAKKRKHHHKKKSRKHHRKHRRAHKSAVSEAAYYATLKQWVAGGGNLVVTDGAAEALVKMGIIGADAVQKHFGYVGYLDIDQRDDPLVKGLPPAARQTYDPITLGYQLRIERDGHWAGQPESGSANMAPIWAFGPEAWEKAGGKAIATVAPADDPKTTDAESGPVTGVGLGTLPFGKGRIVFIGALLPDPVEKYPHWFGLGSYSVTFTGYHIFDQAITWTRPG